MITKAKTITFPGSKGATIYDVVYLFLDNIKDKEMRLGERSAAISFNILLSIPPSLIFLFSLVPFLPLERVQETILNAVYTLTPNPRLYDSVKNIIIDFMETKRRDLLSFGIIATIFVSSNGIMGLLRSFDRKSPALVIRTGIARRWKAIKLTLIIILFFLISIALLILQSNFLNTYVIDFVGSSLLIKIISWVSLVLIIYITICILYKYGPSTRYKMPFFSPGALLSTLLFISVSYGFFYIVANFMNYNKVYGSIGSLMMLMAWLFITGLVMLIGFELNIAIMMHAIKSKNPVLKEK